MSLPNSILEKTVCRHCGEDCDETIIWKADQPFCCQGCKMVFEILEENELSNFYKMGEKPGIQMTNLKPMEYAWLDEKEVMEKLVDFQDEERGIVRFYLPQIHCAACIYLLENLYKLNEGISHSKVDFLKREAKVTFLKGKITLREVVELLASLGYAPNLNFNDLESQPKKVVDKTLIYQLGVAGFAFGNIMLISFPEYLGLEEAVFQKVFGYLNIALAIPVVFFSAKYYWQSAWQALKQKHLNIDVPITLGILTLFGRSLFEIITHTGAGYMDTLAGLVFFLLIGKWFQQKTYRHLSFERDYKSYFPVSANVMVDGELKPTSINKLNIGDRILVRSGELIPADGILQKGRARIDYSFVTGESVPVPKEEGSKLYAGGRQEGSNIELILIKKVSQSYLTQLWNEDLFSKDEKEDTHSSIADRVGKYFTIVILSIAFATLLYWLPKSIPTAVNAFTAVLIIACPCAIALSVPFTLGNALRLLGKKGFYLKNTGVIEKLDKINKIVFDKTGTITQANKSAISYEGVELKVEEKVALKSLVGNSNHPISKLINKWVGAIDLLEVFDFEEVVGEGVRGFSNGMYLEVKKSKEGKKGTELIINGEFKGLFITQNQYRLGLKGLIEKWKWTYQLFLLSGDNDREQKHLEKVFEKQNLYFQQSPKDKLAFIKNLQKDGGQVLMLGDGLNDAGALKQSDVGLVITENTNNFTPASDAILDAKHFSILPQLLDYSSKSIKVVYAAYILALLYNIVGLSYAVTGTLSPLIAAILMPLSSITIVAFGVGLSNYLMTKVTHFE